MEKSERVRSGSWGGGWNYVVGGRVSGKEACKS